MLLETFHNEDEKLEIHTMGDIESPREERENLGTMACFHRYSLGDTDHGLSLGEVKKIEENNRDKYILLPLYLYDHSGVTMNTTGFSCPWDSGKVGIIFVSKEKVLKEFGWKKISKKRKEKVLDYLRAEVNTYDQYLRGEVYGFIKYKGDEEVDSCWGFYGDDHKDSGLFDQAGWAA